MNKRHALIASGLVIAGVVGWDLYAPFYTLQQLKRAIEERDRHAFVEYVDMGALRGDIKTEIQDYLTEDVLDGGDGNPLDTIVTAVGGLAFADTVVDKLVTPTMIMRLADDPKAGEGGHDERIGMAFANPKVDRRGLSEFRLVDDKEPSENDQLIFRRAGLGWKLVGIQFAEGRAKIEASLPAMTAREGADDTEATASEVQEPTGEIDETEAPTFPENSVFGPADEGALVCDAGAEPFNVGWIATTERNEVTFNGTRVEGEVVQEWAPASNEIVTFLEAKIGPRGFPMHIHETGELTLRSDDGREVSGLCRPE